MHRLAASGPSPLDQTRTAALCSFFESEEPGAATCGAAALHVSCRSARTPPPVRIRLNAKVAQRVYQFRMSQQPLPGPQVAGSLIEQVGRRPVPTVLAIASWVETDQRHPLADEPALPEHRQVLARAAGSRNKASRPQLPQLLGQAASVQRVVAVSRMLRVAPTSAERQWYAGGCRRLGARAIAPAFTPRPDFPLQKALPSTRGRR